MLKMHHGKHINKKALLRTRIRSIATKLGHTGLSLALVYTMFPTAAIAYALEAAGDTKVIAAEATQEDVSAEQTPVKGPQESAAPSQTQTPATDDEAQQTDAADNKADTDEGRAAKDDDVLSPDDATLDDAKPDTRQDGASSPKNDESSEAKVTTAAKEAKSTKAAPRRTPAAGDSFSVEATFGATFYDSSNNALSVIDGRVYHNGEVHTIVTVAGTGLEQADLGTPTTNDSSTVALDSFDARSSTATYTLTYPITGGTYKPTVTFPVRDDANVTHNVYVVAPATVVIDTTGPTATITLVDRNGAMVDADATDSNLNYFDLPAQDSRLVVRVQATDGSGSGVNYDDASNNVTVSWNAVDSGSVSREGRTVTFDNDGLATGDLLTFAATDFFAASEGVLAKATLTVNLKDRAGNLATYKLARKAGESVDASDTYELTSESGVLAAYPYTMTVTKDGTTADPIERDGVDTYNGPVVVSVQSSGDKDLLARYIDFEDTAKNAVKVNDAYPVEGAVSGSLGDNTYVATVSNTGASNASYTVKATIATRHGATWKTDASFAIDTTTPTATVAVSETPAPVSDLTIKEAPVWGKGSAPSFAVTVTNATSLTDTGKLVLTSTDEGAASPLEARVELGAADADGTRTATVSVDAGEYTDGAAYKAAFAGTTIFGNDVTSEMTGAVIVDDGTPTVTLTFSKPFQTLLPDGTFFGGDRASTDEALTPVFFKDQDAASPQVGSVVVRVTDVTLPNLGNNESLPEAQRASVRLYNDSGIDKVLRVTWAEDGENAYEASIPYDKLTDGVEANTYLGEGTGLKLEVRAADLAENVTTYVYNNVVGDSKTTVDGVGKLSDSFTVDTTPVSFVSLTYEGVTPSTHEDGSGHTIDAFGVETTSDTVTAVVRVSDANFDSEPTVSAITVTKYSYEGSGGERALSQGERLAVEYAWERVGTTDDWVAKVALPGTTDNSLYQLELNANDLARNVSCKVAPMESVSGATYISVDATGPIVELVMNEAPKAAYEGADVYAADVTATVSVADANFVGADASCKIVVTDKAGVPSSIDVPMDAWEVAGDVHTYSLSPFATNALGASHTITVLVRDAVGKTSSLAYGDKGTKAADGTPIVGNAKFVVDTEAPEVSVSLDTSVAFTQADGDREIDYYTATTGDVALVATVTVRDNAFSVTDTTKIEGGDGIDASAYEVTPFTRPDAVHKPYEWTATVTYKDESKAGAYYGLRFAAADVLHGEGVEGHTYAYAYGPADTVAAGAPVKGSAFALDATAPTVLIDMGPDWRANDGMVTGSERGTDYYNKKVRPVVRVYDENLDVSPATKIVVERMQGSTVLETITKDVGENWKLGTDEGRSYHEYTDEGFELDNLALGEFYVLRVQAQDLIACTTDDSLKAAHATTYAYGEMKEGCSTTAKGAPRIGESFVVDTVAPKVDVAFDKALVGTLDSVDYYVAGSDASDVLEATVTVTDDHFNVDWATSLVETMGGTVSSESWTPVPEASPQNQWSAIATFGESAVDTTHDLKATVSDWAQNTTTYKYAEASNDVATEADGTPVPAGSRTFVVDNTDPKITVNFGVEPVGADKTPAEGGVDYYAEQPVATITVVDKNFDSTGTTVTPVGAIDTGVWEPVGDTWTRTYTFGENRVNTDEFYSTLSMVAYDKVHAAAEAAGTTVEGHNDTWNYATGTRNGKAHDSSVTRFVYDNTRPEVQVEVSETPQQVNYAGTGTDYYGTTTNGTLNICLTVTENNFDSDKASSAIKVTGGVATPHGDTPWYRPDAVRHPNTWVADVRYAANKDNVASDLQARMVDMVYTVAGSADKPALEARHTLDYDYGGTSANTKAGGAYMTLGSSFVLDLDAPVLTTATARTEYSGAYLTQTASGRTYSEPYLFYNTSGAGLNLVMSDDNGLQGAAISSPFSFAAGSTLTGIDALTTTQRVSLLEGNAASRLELTRSILVSLEDHAHNRSVWNISPAGSVTLVRAGGPATVGNSVVDALASLRSMHPISLVRDTVTPRLSWATSVTPGSYYNTTQTVTLNVEELNFGYLKSYDSGQRVLTVSEYAGNAGRALSTYGYTVGNFTGSDPSYAYTQTFDHDGHYVLAARLTDPASNTSPELRFEEFTIDKTAPVINSVTYDNNDVRNGKYYKAARTATITVTEHNWDPALVNITTNGSVSGWSTNGDTHTCTVSFASDGTYNLSVSAADRAGNQATPYQAEEFVVDMTTPTITFGGAFGDHTLEKREGVGVGELSDATNGTVAPEVTFADEANFDINGTSVVLMGNKKGEVYYTRAEVASGNGSVVRYEDFDYDIAVDDIYTIDARVTDMAGNDESATITFSVNRFGSTYYVESVDVDGVDHAGDEWLTDAPEIVMHEVNVSADTEQNVLVTRPDASSGALRVATSSRGEFAGYTVEEVLDRGWHEYTYRIGSGNFDDEGGYSVNLTSADDAGNDNTTVSFFKAIKALGDADRVNDGSESSNNTNHTGEYQVKTVEAPKEAAAGNVNVIGGAIPSNAEVAFTLDTIPPEAEIVASGPVVSGDGYVATLRVTDDIKAANETVVVKVNGEKVGDVSGPDASGNYTFTVPARSFVPSAVHAVVIDYAGRTTEADASFYVTGLVPEIGVGVVAVAVIVGGGVYVAKRRRRLDM